eukprot:12692177-Heterocapsa_arctica.AAC.1
MIRVIASKFTCIILLLNPCCPTRCSGQKLFRMIVSKLASLRSRWPRRYFSRDQPLAPLSRAWKSRLHFSP